MLNAEKLPASPCVRNCCLNGDDICLGCFRSLDEIRLWSAADRRTRELFLQCAAKRRSGIMQSGRPESIYFKQPPKA